MNDDLMRISDAEREQAAGALGEHYAQGRITSEEHSERLDLIWSARTRAQLAPVFADLPGPRGPAATPAPAPPPRFRGRARRLPPPVLAVLAVLVTLTVLTHLPLILFGLLVWFLISHGRHGGRHHGFGQRRSRSMG